MPRAYATGWVVVLVITTGLGLSASASGADTSGGGFSAPARPRIETATCSASTEVCRRGEVLTVSGRSLAAVESVVFLGKPGRKDDAAAAPRLRGDRRLTVTIPLGAHSGRVRAVAASASATGPSLKVRAPRPGAAPPVAAPLDVSAASADAGVFPIKGKHDLGQTATNNFGGARNHKGQDLFATCGTPLVAALGGTVTMSKFESRAGNYVVITDPSGQSEVYMHLRAPALVETGDTVTTGQPIGEVGDTGDADGCHLHFELWTAPGWYMGGHAIDPLPTLKHWEGQAEA